MATPATTQVTDDTQLALAGFAHDLRFADIGEADVERCTLHIIDTFASLMAGYFSDAGRTARTIAQTMQVPTGASVLGTRLRAEPDLAAFVNATTSREAEQNDVYFPVIGGGNHPSDVLLPLFGVAEHAGSSGRELIAAIIVAYQIFLHIADQAKIVGFDQSTIAGIAVAAGAGRLLSLPPAEIAEAIAIAAVANNPLNQSRRDTLTMWKAAAAGQAGRAGVFAATLARAGMKGPSLPFAGQLGWSSIVARAPLDMTGLDFRNGHRVRLRDVMIKPRAACASAISSILAAEKAFADINDPQAITRVVVETYESARVFIGDDAIHWNPTTRESADHSIPYAVAATLVDGTAGTEQFMPARLFDPVIRQVLAKVEVCSRDDFSAAYRQYPPEHHTRVTVTLSDGRAVIGEAGGAKGDMSSPPTAESVATKFRDLCTAPLGRARTESALDLLTQIATLETLAAIPQAFVVTTTD
jgi:2-methylcitrate dehydratase